MNLNQRIEILVQLGEYLSTEEMEWQMAREKATRENGWFVPEFINLAITNIKEQFLSQGTLTRFADQYPGIADQTKDKRLGIVMAGNIPLVGFHDFLCGFLSGYQLLLKPSSKDEVLIKHLVQVIKTWHPDLENLILFADQLKGCDAYIATGSNNSGRYFEYYFRNYPSIIRKNRTSIAVLTGDETEQQLASLADDMMLYFGLGCRNVSKIYVPEGYDFQRLLAALKPYKWMADHNKYRNNYDYNLALHILNNKFYMTDGTLLLIENESLFSPIAQVHYEFYRENPVTRLRTNHSEEIQCISGEGGIPLGLVQAPAINDFADGIDTMTFLTGL
ncbi:MAG TPA: acyl-CoA reductase [Phnomibacter sp.]|nr:acyl-CoA reductase [Phnomibacter sp.]